MVAVVAFNLLTVTSSHKHSQQNGKENEKSIKYAKEMELLVQKMGKKYVYIHIFVYQMVSKYFVRVQITMRTVMFCHIKTCCTPSILKCRCFVEEKKLDAGKITSDTTI